MEVGILKKSRAFHSTDYWVIKCENEKIKGNRNGDLPIDPLSFNIHPSLNREGLKVNFKLIEIGNADNYKWYACIN